MHIVYISREYPPSQRGGGIATYLQTMARGMAARGHQVTVICASDDTRKSYTEVDHDVRVFRLKGGDFIIRGAEQKTLLRRFRPLYRFTSYRRQIRQLVRSLKPVDLIEVAEYGAESQYLHGLGIPVIVRLHTPSHLDRSNFGKQPLKWSNWPFYYAGQQQLREIARADYITSCSASLLEWTRKYVRLKARLIDVIYNPIDIAALSSPSSSSSSLSTPNSYNLLFAGSITDMKGCGDLAEAGMLLQNQLNHPFTITFAGKTGRYADELRQFYGQQPWFNLVGKLDHAQLLECYRQADVVVLPSWWDNMPMTCLEAMAQGSLVIGSNAGGMAEIIHEGRDGFLVAPHHPAELARKIAKVLLLGRTRKEQVARRAQSRIRQSFTLPIILSQMEGFYQSVLADWKKSRH